MNLRFLKTDSMHPDFRLLEPMLDEELRKYDGDEADFYAQFNKSILNKISHILLVYQNDQAVACGAVKNYDIETAEIKRMYVLPEFRGQGIAVELLNALEDWARQLGYSKSILETGKKQVSAVRLYEKCGYDVIPNYGQYIGIDNSVCMHKIL